MKYLEVWLDQGLKWEDVRKMYEKVCKIIPKIMIPARNTYMAIYNTKLRKTMLVGTVGAYIQYPMHAPLKNIEQWQGNENTNQSHKTRVDK